MDPAFYTTRRAETPQTLRCPDCGADLRYVGGEDWACSRCKDPQTDSGQRYWRVAIDPDAARLKAENEQLRAALVSTRDDVMSIGGALRAGTASRQRLGILAANIRKALATTEHPATPTRPDNTCPQCGEPASGRAAALGRTKQLLWCPNSHSWFATAKEAR